MIDCDDQAEVDRLWDALTASGGEPGPCGWLKDRFGLSWQIVPRRLDELLNDPDSDVPAGRWRRCSRWARSRSPRWRTPPTGPDGSMATYVLIRGAGDVAGTGTWSNGSYESVATTWWSWTCRSMTMRRPCRTMRSSWSKRSVIGART